MICQEFLQFNDKKRYRKKKVSLLLIPEKIVQRLIQSPADGNAQVDGGVIVPLLDGVDGLAGRAYQVRKGLLAQTLGGAGGAETEVFHGVSSISAF